MSRTDRDVNNSTLSGSSSLCSARGIAVGLSFFIAACSSPGIKVTSPDAWGSNKSSHVLGPQILSVSSVGDITLDSNYPEETLTSGIQTPHGAFSSSLQQVDLAYCKLAGDFKLRRAGISEGDSYADYYLFPASIGYLAHLQQADYVSGAQVSTYASGIEANGYCNSVAQINVENIQPTGKERDTTKLTVGGLDIILVAYQGNIDEEATIAGLVRHQYLQQYAEIIKDGHSVTRDTDGHWDMYPEGILLGGQHGIARLARSLITGDLPETPLIRDERTGFSLINPAILSGAPPDFYA